MKSQGLPAQRTLRDGTIVTIRLQTAADARALLDFYRALPEEDRQYLDDDVTTAEWINRFIQGSNFKTRYPLVAEAGGRMIGHAWLLRTLHGWMSHVGQLRCAVASDQQRKGLGSALVREILHIAEDVGLDMMTARVLEDQVNALRTLEKLGFKREAVLHGYVRDIQGHRRNLVILGNDISQIWQAMEILVADTPPT
jgi:L-amino acid N-acyltransferase YncA